MALPDVLEPVRGRYADELAATAPIHDAAIRAAFATVPREHFLGPPPWTLVTVTSPGGETTSDPVQLYRDVLVAIDVTRGLNNGEPKLWARLFDRLGVRPGERVAHVGTGTGYYTAILAEIVGREGQVLGIEVDEDLAPPAPARTLSPGRRRRHASATGWRRTSGQWTRSWRAPACRTCLSSGWMRSRMADACWCRRPYTARGGSALSPLRTRRVAGAPCSSSLATARASPPSSCAP